MTRTYSLLAWSVLLALIIGAVFLVSKDDLETVVELEEIYERRQALLQRLQLLPSREETIRRRLADLGNEAAERLLYEAEGGAVQSFMQRDLRELASVSGIRIARMQTSRQSAGDTPGLLGASRVQVSLTGSHEAFVEFLSNIEAKEPLMNIERLVVRVERQASRYEAARLSVTAEVVGFHKR